GWYFDKECTQGPVNPAVDKVATEGENGVITLYALWDIEIVVVDDYIVYVEHGDKGTATAGGYYVLNVMLKWENNYTQVNDTFIEYDSDLFEYVEFVYLANVASAITFPEDDVFGLRNAPTVNLLTGTPCYAPPVMLAQIIFKVKDDAVSGTKASFEVTTATVYPNALDYYSGKAGIVTSPGNKINVTIE
ncbi:MAG: hypothetical protein FWF04_04605, partial [Clostridiales bacterium]|nr:hypothetical protein [Clostridiales bacterium]